MCSLRLVMSLTFSPSYQIKYYSQYCVDKIKLKIIMDLYSAEKGLNVPGYQLLRQSIIQILTRFIVIYNFF